MCSLNLMLDRRLWLHKPMYRDGGTGNTIEKKGNQNMLFAKYEVSAC